MVPPSLSVVGQGLSPLARGNLLSGVGGAVGCGSIRARAGQPCSLGGPARLGKVYPRSRGATFTGNVVRRTNLGLSPLARGNLVELVQPVLMQGSIPARAGQPAVQGAAPLNKGVYPRSRGATFERGCVPGSQ